MNENASRGFPFRLELCTIVNENGSRSALQMLVARPARDDFAPGFGLGVLFRNGRVFLIFAGCFVPVTALDAQFALTPLQFVESRLLGFAVRETRQNAGTEAAHGVPELFAVGRPREIGVKVIGGSNGTPHVTREQLIGAFASEVLHALVEIDENAVEIAKQFERSSCCLVFGFLALGSKKG